MVPEYRSSDSPLRVHLRTRGYPRELDYDFIGVSPDRFWWRYYQKNEWTDVEKAVILAESDDDGWRIYLQGLESRRRDYDNTVIMFGVVLSAPRNEPLDSRERAFVLGLVARWLADIAEPTEYAVGAQRLDELLSAEEADRLCAERGTEAAERAEEIVRVAFAEFATDVPASPDMKYVSWIGDISDPRARAAFLARIAAFVDGTRGRALVLTHVENEHDVTGLLAQRTGGVAVLAARKSRTPFTGVRELAGKGTTPRPPVPGPTPQPTVRKVLIAISIVLLVGLLVWVIWTLVGTNSSPSR
ncbi:MAG: hypothetical protein IRY84_06205 [Thermobispora bispora]|nr:hypothetical protein [Thermobispora bispora]